MKGIGVSTFQLPEIEDLNQDIGSNYEVTDLIGSGGMGAVYLATQAGLDRKVAIKILPDHIDGPRSRFEAEAQVLAQCTHPNIVAIYDFGETKKGIPYLVMEYLEGDDLQVRLDRGDITDRERFSWLRQICDGLAYAHARGMAHLDIKPANLLVDEEGDVKIVDFGLARMIGRNQTPYGGGTPLYAAPETFNPDAEVDQRADIYSLGVVIYQMITGKIPKGIWLPPSETNIKIDPGFDKIVEYCLKKNPSSRYQNIVELEADLMEIFFAHPGKGTASTRLTPPELKKRLIYIFLGILLSQVIGSIFNVWYNQKYIIPLFFEGESYRYTNAVHRYHFFAYLPLIALWGWLLHLLGKPTFDRKKAGRIVVNLPWWTMGLAAAGWFGTIPGLWLPLQDAGTDFLIQLSISVCIGAAIAISQGFLVVDLLSQKLLYPHFFSKNEKPWDTPGGISLSLSRRGFFWLVSSGICPVIALFLLVGAEHRIFALGVAMACVGFGIFGGWLLTRLIVEPINELSQAAVKVGSGDLRTRVDFVAADELGILGYEFNQMVTGLREREYIRDTLGRSQGKEAIETILKRGEKQRGSVRRVVIVAMQIDQYLATMKSLPPDEAVRFAETINRSVAGTVERFGGQVHQNSGSVYTAVFGMVPGSRNPCGEALKAAESIRDEIVGIDTGSTLMVKIGIDEGEALIGTLEGSRQRDLLVIGEVVENALALAAQAGSEINLSDRARCSGDV